VDGTTTVVGGGEEGTTTAEEGAGFCTTVSLWKPQAVSARERRARQANAFMIVLLQGDIQANAASVAAVPVSTRGAQIVGRLAGRMHDVARGRPAPASLMEAVDEMIPEAQDDGRSEAQHEASA
jgi:hypothetical protein